MARKNPAAVALGHMKSPAKKRASRANGRLGGRRPKFEIGDTVRANDHAPGDYRGRRGTVTERGPNKNEYRVEYSDGGQPYGYLMSWWLDAAKPHP